MTQTSGPGKSSLCTLDGALLNSGVLPMQLFFGKDLINHQADEVDGSCMALHDSDIPACNSSLFIILDGALLPVGVLPMYFRNTKTAQRLCMSSHASRFFALEAALQHSCVAGTCTFSSIACRPRRRQRRLWQIPRRRRRHQLRLRCRPHRAHPLPLVRLL